MKATPPDPIDKLVVSGNVIDILINGAQDTGLISLIKTFSRRIGREIIRALIDNLKIDTL